MSMLGQKAETYILGHSEAELERLSLQARFYAPISQQAMRLAGITSGMQVLDVGCGLGDVSFLLAEMVGPGGSVIGVDKSEEAVATAQMRAAYKGLTNVRFAVSTIMDYAPNVPVDAVVGRLILQHLPDAVAALAHLATLVKPGGIMLFEEFDVTAAHTAPHSPLADNILSWVCAAFRRMGVEPDTGSRLYRLFQLAGLPEPQMNAGTRVEAGADSQVYALLEGIVRTLLPIIVRSGIAAKEEIEIETLEARLRAEMMAMNAVVFTPTLVSAWTRLP